MIKRTLIISLFVLSISALGFTDSGSFEGQGENVFPLFNTNIEMVAETVNIYKTQSGKWKAECAFWFHNIGRATSIQMGFPDFPSGHDEGNIAWKYNHGSIDSFKCIVDNHNVQYELKKGIKNPIDSTLLEYPRVFTWNVAFSDDETKRIFTSYLFGGDTDGYYLTIEYILRTGSLWKGKIKRADINIDVINIPRELIENIKPDGYEYTKGHIIWKLREFEPVEDISILLNGTAIWWCGQADKAIERDSIQLMKECLQCYIESFNELPNEMYILTNDRVTVKKKAYRLLSLLLQKKDKSTITCRTAYHLDKRETCDSLVHKIYNDLEAGIIQNDIDYWYLAKYISGRYLHKTELTYNLLNRYVEILTKRYNGDREKIDSIKQIQKKTINSI